MQNINEEIATLEAQVEQIEEEHAKTKKKIKDLKPSVCLHVLSLKAVYKNIKYQWKKIQSSRPSQQTSNTIVEFIKQVGSIVISLKTTLSEYNNFRR